MFLVARRVLRNRSALDRKAHFKGAGELANMKVFQVGTVVEHGSEFYSSRVPKRQRHVRAEACHSGRMIVGVCACWSVPLRTCDCRRLCVLKRGIEDA